MVGRNQAPRAGHVSGDNARIARDMFCHMARHEARVDIGSARGWVANDEVDCFAPVEFFHGLGEDRKGEKQSKREGASDALRVNSKGSELSWFENMADGR